MPQHHYGGDIYKRYYRPITFKELEKKRKERKALDKKKNKPESFLKKRQRLKMEAKPGTYAARLKAGRRVLGIPSPELQRQIEQAAKGPTKLSRLATGARTIAKGAGRVGLAGVGQLLLSIPSSERQGQLPKGRGPKKPLRSRQYNPRRGPQR